MALAREIMGGGASAGLARAMFGQNNTAVTAAGSLQTDATAIVSSKNIVAGADGTKGVILPAVGQGTVTIFNNSASSLKVWPPVGAAIAVPATGLGSANAAYTQTTYSVVTYEWINSTQIVPNKSS